MRSQFCRVAAVCSFLVVSSVSCGDSSGPDGSNGARSASLQIVSGSQASDTVQAQPTVLLTVEVRDSSGAKAAQGTAVNFTAVATTINSGMLVRAVTSPDYVPLVAAQTDAAGRASVSIKYGTLAGPGRVAISVPSLALSDTARYTILSGNATQLSALPADTAIYAGRSYTLRSAAADRFGNVRGDPVTYTAVTPGLSVSGTGVVTAAEIGRYTLQVSTPSIPQPATRSVSVVPQGTLTALLTSPRIQIIRVDLDGSNYRELTSGTDGPLVHPDPKWIPGTNTIVYAHYNGTRSVLQTVDENGVVAPFIKNAPATMSHQAFPSPARNAPVVYFGAYDSRCPAGDFCLHRAANDGSNPELLGTNALVRVSDGLSSSPNGSMVVYNNGFLRIFDYASKTSAAISNSDHFPSWSPTWSPDGSKLAFVSNLDGSLRVSDATGTNDRRIDLTQEIYAFEPVSWTSDSRWVLARRFFGTLQLVDVTTGMVLPLGYSLRYGPADLK